jgi:hypothetical protein
MKQAGLPAIIINTKFLVRPVQGLGREDFL